MLLRRPTQLQLTEGLNTDCLRVFVEHLTSRVFIFARSRVFAYDLTTLEYVYSVHHIGIPLQNQEEELCARWDTGHSFLLWHADGQRASVWCIADGSAHGEVETGLPLISCDLSHTTFHEDVAAIRILATLDRVVPDSIGLILRPKTLMFRCLVCFPYLDLLIRGHCSQAHFKI